MSNCPICQTELSKESIAVSPITFGYECERCGKFVLSSETKRYLEYLLQTNHLEKDVISHAIRKMQKKNYDCWPLIDNRLLDAILKHPLPTPSEQVDNLIQWFGENVSPGQFYQIEPLMFQSIAGTKNSDGLRWILEYLVERGFLQHEAGGGVITDPYVLTLSFEGWGYYKQLEKGATNSHRAFMAMKYGDKELDCLVEKYFKPAVACTGFELFRLDENPQAGLIDDRLRVEIRNSKFLIADLTHENNGAYWEAGYAEGLGKPVIYTCQKEKFDKQKTHFDTNHHLTVKWDSEEIQKAMEMLKATIRATLPYDAKLSDEYDVTKGIKHEE